MASPGVRLAFLYPSVSGVCGLSNQMADKLEELWKKLIVIEEEGEDIVLGRNSTRVAKEAGKAT